MKGDVIEYRECKYCLAKTYSVAVPIYPDVDISTEDVELTTAGILTISRGYPWNGADGPTQDSPDTMRPSLTHDAIYDLFAAGLLDMKWRAAADETLALMLREDAQHVEDETDGRAPLWNRAVAAFGARYAGTERPVLIAPRPFPPWRQEWPES